MEEEVAELVEDLSVVLLACRLDELVCLLFYLGEYPREPLGVKGCDIRASRVCLLSFFEYLRKLGYYEWAGGLCFGFTPQRPVKAGLLPGVAGWPFGLDQQKERISVAVVADGLDLLEVVGGLALYPQRVP